MPVTALPQSITVETDDDTAVQPTDDGVVIQLPDGNVVIDLSERRAQQSKGFDDNLAEIMSPGLLQTIAEDLLNGIEADLQSRTQWETSRSRGIDLLGLKIDEPRSDLGAAGAPLEGMSTVRDSTLLEAVITGQANAIGELLPSEGPVKVSNEGQETEVNDELAEELEKDFNYYLTSVATEYYPDTKRMFFWTYFGGSGFKKVYPCPIRRRPVSESIDTEDLIVSNAATDLANAARVTHRIKMRPGVMKRMQYLGVYRDVPLTQPSTAKSKVENKLEQVEGIDSAANTRPEDQSYTLYESYCELDLDEYAPKQFKGKSVPLPYRVTIDRDSKEILEVHRNWKEDDEACLPRKYFVRYPFIEGLGIYGIGLVNILGNDVSVLTGVEREMLDAGMFASFPGFIISKEAARQLTNEFRVPPGGSVQVATPPSGKVSDAISSLPYKDVSSGLMSLYEAKKDEARRLGGTADIPIGEGVQNAPVGTTMALIEQATKVESAVHKGFHFAQSEEFQLLKERFEEDPEAFWRHKPKSNWTKQRFLAALANVELTPKADPNTPSHIHRLMKAAGLKQLQMANPQIYDAKKVDTRVMHMMRIDDPEDLFVQQAPSGPDPKVIEATAKLMTAQTGQQKLQIAAKGQEADLANQAQNRESKENIETAKLAQAMIVHGSNQANQDRSHALAVTDSAHQRIMDLHEALKPPEPPATPSS